MCLDILWWLQSIVPPLCWISVGLVLMKIWRVSDQGQSEYQKTEKLNAERSIAAVKTMTECVRVCYPRMTEDELLRKLEELTQPKAPLRKHLQSTSRIPHSSFSATQCPCSLRGLCVGACAGVHRCDPHGPFPRSPGPT